MPKDDDCEKYELIRLAQQDDKKALERLTQENMGLVYSIAHKLAGRGAEPEDLIQLGSVGLVKAIYKFDSSFGVKFSTYAVPLILGEMKRFLRDDGPVKVSRSLKALSAKAYAAKERLSASLNREPTIGEIASELGESAEDLAAAMEASAPPESLYAACGDNESLLLIDKISGGSSHEAESVNRIALMEAVKALNEREQKIIILRYFKDKTQSQTAAQLGISQVQVSRLEKKILQTMRKSLSAG